MKKKVALIIGITGQDGSYLAEFLIKKKYIVHGMNRRTSLFNTARIESIFNNKKYKNILFLHYGDLNDFGSINQIIRNVNPDEIYNLGAQSHVMVSFETPEYTTNTIALGTLRILEIIKNFNPRIKYYNASSSEMYGDTKTKPQNEKTVFNPNSPYATAKLYSHLMTVNYREAYGLFACNGILFNHESPRRGPTFVTKKIVNGLVRIKEKKQKILLLGNIYSKRDWGHARDYVEAQYKILQAKKPDDFVIATGVQYSVKQFIDLVLSNLKIDGYWTGSGLKEMFVHNGKKIIGIDKKYFRPKEVSNLVGDFSKAKKKLNWKPKVNINQLLSEMIDESYKEIKRENNFN